MSLQISFLGAADTVTGSRHLVDIGGQRILLDCGLFQGFKMLARAQLGAALAAAARDRRRGAEPRPPGPQRLAAGAGEAGLQGPGPRTPATRDLAEVLLLDSAHLQEEDARRANRYGYSRHAPALPLYTVADAQRAIARIVPLPAGRDGARGRRARRLTPVGHLLGACAVTLRRRRARWCSRATWAAATTC